MKISEVANWLGAEILTPDTDCEREVFTACGSDMMSDVLAYVKDQALLLTGLNNPQVIRTADRMDMICVVFVRGKRPEQPMLDMASNMGISVLATDKTMFHACGILYGAGLREYRG